MKILLIFDGSSYSNMAIHILKTLRLSSPTKVTVMTVVPEYTFLRGITLSNLKNTSTKKKEQQEAALNLTDAA